MYLHWHHVKIALGRGLDLSSGRVVRVDSFQLIT